MRIAYINGRYRPSSDEAVSVRDRAFQFADSVYEVILVIGGKMIDADLHLDRLERSLHEISLGITMKRPALLVILSEVMRRNRVRDGMLYVQVTRGAAERNLLFPKDAIPFIVVTARPMVFKTEGLSGIRVMTTPDIRWARVDIKSTALLPNLLAKQRATQSGYDDVWFTDPDGLITEASGANAWIVTPRGELVTRPLSNAILHGITRAIAQKLAAEAQIKFVERAFTVAEAEEASEAFITSATALLTPVRQINDAVIGDPGPVTRKLIEHYRDYWH